jgi:hypothetical protein
MKNPFEVQMDENQSPLNAMSASSQAALSATMSSLAQLSKHPFLNMGNNVGSGSNSPPSVVQVRTIVKHLTIFQQYSCRRLVSITLRIVYLHWPRYNIQTLRQQ